MIYGILADIMVVIHLLFILIAVLGGLLMFKWKRFAWIQIPSAIWGAVIEFKGYICPLTPIENCLRVQSGDSGYESGFIEHYILPVLYLHEPSQTLQVALGIGVIAVNLFIYYYVIRHHWRKRKKAIE